MIALKELYDVSPFVYSCGKTIRNKNIQPHSVSSECCNVFNFVTKGSAVHQVDSRKRILEKGTLKVQTGMTPTEYIKELEK